MPQGADTRVRQHFLHPGLELLAWLPLPWPHSALSARPRASALTAADLHIDAGILGSSPARQGRLCLMQLQAQAGQAAGRRHRTQHVLCEALGFLWALPRASPISAHHVWGQRRG